MILRLSKEGGSLREGYLQKKGSGGMRRWKTRWFVLTVDPPVLSFTIDGFFRTERSVSFDGKYCEEDDASSRDIDGNTGSRFTFGASCA